MKILYDANDGKIYYVVSDVHLFYFTHSTNIPLTEFEIDEVGPNAATCVDLARTRGRLDVDGDPKYSMIDNAGTWELHEKDGWEEAPIDV